MCVGMGGKTLQIDVRGNKCNCFCCVRPVDETDGPKKRFACLLKRVFCCCWNAGTVED